MTLTTHALVGAAVAQFFPQNPATAFIAGFASHLLIDSIPHWDYKLLSYKEDPANVLNSDMDMSGKNFLIDLFKISADALLGIFLSILILLRLSALPWTVAFMGAVGGLAPDALQFIYFKTRQKWLAPLQKFHALIQQNRSFREKPVIGLFIQLVLISALFYAVYLFK